MEALDSLEHRIQALEAVVGTGVSSSSSSAAGPKILAQLRETPHSVGQSSSKYPQKSIIEYIKEIKLGLSHLLKNAPELAEYLELVKELEPYVTHSVDSNPLLLPPDVMKEIVLESEGLVRRVASMMEAVDQLKPHMEIPNLKDKLPALNELRRMHGEQMLSAQSVSEDTADALQRYRLMVNVVSQLFIQWDEIILKLES